MATIWKLENQLQITVKMMAKTNDKYIRTRDK